MSNGRGSQNTEELYSLKVDNLTYRTTIDDLRRLFDKYGDVGDVYIPKDRYSRESRGFAFVRYYDIRDAEDAILATDGMTMDGRDMRVQMARYGRTESRINRSPPRRGRGGNRYRRSRSRSTSRPHSRSCSRSRSRSRSRRRDGGQRWSRSPSHSRGSRSRSRSRDNY